MSCLIVSKYAYNVLVVIPWTHWAVMGMLALMAFLIFWKKSSVYGMIMMGLAAFMGAFLLDTAVFLRLFGILPHASGVSFSVGFDRLFHGSVYSRAELFSNFAVFVPFGFFLSEFISSTERFGTGGRIGFVTLAAFGMSMLIESLQLILHVGFFELTDLLMNTLGGFFGACLSLLGRAALRRFRKTG